MSEGGKVLQERGFRIQQEGGRELFIVDVFLSLVPDYEGVAAKSFQAAEGVVGRRIFIITRSQSDNSTESTSRIHMATLE